MGIMSTDDTTKLVNRVRRVKGQVEAVERMIADHANCVDILMQISAAIGALRKVGETVLEQHLQTSVQQALASPEASERAKKVDELMEVFRRYGK